jgi:hypothetical protein
MKNFPSIAGNPTSFALILSPAMQDSHELPLPSPESCPLCPQVFLSPSNCLPHPERKRELSAPCNITSGLHLRRLSPACPCVTPGQVGQPSRHPVAVDSGSPSLTTGAGAALEAGSHLRPASKLGHLGSPSAALSFILQTSDPVCLK